MARGKVELRKRDVSRLGPKARRTIHVGTPDVETSRPSNIYGEAEFQRREHEAALRARRSAASTRTAEARAASAERRAADATPPAAGPTGQRRARPSTGRSSRRLTSGARSARKVRKAIGSLGGRNPSATIIAELVGALAITTAYQVADGEVPAPSTYVAPFLVYLVLAFVAEVGGPQSARLAAGFGALVLLSLALARGDQLVKVFGGAAQATSLGPPTSITGRKHA